MTARATTPVLPAPKTVVFLDSTNESSGRVVSSTTRKIIRSHVMREYRRQQHERPDQLESTSSSRRVKQKKVLSSGAENAILLAQSASPASNERSVQDRSRDTDSECSAVHWPSRHPVQSPYYLDTATNAFVYAGNSSIDFRSYALFNHYASECRCITLRSEKSFPSKG